jgi:hypothetical protein
MKEFNNVLEWWPERVFAFEEIASNSFRCATTGHVHAVANEYQSEYLCFWALTPDGIPVYYWEIPCPECKCIHRIYQNNTERHVSPLVTFKRFPLTAQ